MTHVCVSFVRILGALHNLLRDYTRERVCVAHEDPRRPSQPPFIAAIFVGWRAHQSALPDLVSDPASFASGSTVRLSLDPSYSALYSALCQNQTARGNCTFKSEVGGSAGRRGAMCQRTSVGWRATMRRGRIGVVWQSRRSARDPHATHAVALVRALPLVLRARSCSTRRSRATAPSATSTRRASCRSCRATTRRTTQTRATTTSTSSRPACATRFPRPPRSSARAPAPASSAPTRSRRASWGDPARIAMHRSRARRPTLPQTLPPISDCKRRRSIATSDAATDQSAMARSRRDEDCSSRGSPPLFATKPRTHSQIMTTAALYPCPPPPARAAHPPASKGRCAPDVLHGEDDRRTALGRDGVRLLWRGSS